MDNKKEIPIDILNSIKTWDLQVRILRILHGILGTFAIVASVLVASGLEAFGINIKWLAALSAIVLGLLSSFGLGAKVNNMRAAERMLRVAVNRFKYEENYTIENLLTVYRDSETLIGPIEFNQ